MSRKTPSLTLLALCAALVVPVSAKTHLRIASTADAMDGFENWTSGTPWEQISKYDNRNATRPVVDLLLELQALRAGGLDFDYEFDRCLTFDLAKNDLVQGKADIAAETIWDSEIDAAGGKLLKAEPVIRDGEFVKGVYVLPNRSELLKISSLDELRGYTGAVVATWNFDVKCVEDMKLKGVVKTATPEIAFLHLRKGDADFTLAEFSATPDMAVTTGGVRLVPAPNCKVALPGSRSWAVSKASPDAAEILAALKAGTKKLRASGTITRAYIESGFFNPRVADWKRLF